MRILEVEAIAFGPLRGERLVLAPGLSLVYGPNEAGKSSWHAALQLGLGGLRRARGRRPKAEEELVRRHQPWGGGEWKVRLLVELDSGRTIELTQDLADPAQSRALDAATGRDLGGELIFDGSIDGSRLLGLDRDIFADTLCVRQAQLLAVRDRAGGLQEQLQRAAALTGADETAEAALERLRAFRSERVGSRRRGSTKPLPSAEVAAREASRALEAARGDQLTLDRLRAKLEDARREEERCAAAHASARRELELRVRADLAERVAAIRPLAARFAAGPPAPTAPVEEEARGIAELLTSWQAHPAPEPLAPGPDSAALERELDALPPLPQGDLEAAPAVESAQEEYRRAADALDLHLRRQEIPPESRSAVDAPAAELRGLAEILARALPEVEPGLERTRRHLESRIATVRRATIATGSVAAAILALAFLLALEGRPVWAVVLAAVAAAGALVAVASGRSRAGLERERAGVAVEDEAQRRRRYQAEDELAAARERLGAVGLPADADAAWQAAAVVDDAESRRERLLEWRRREVQLQAARAGAEAALRRALAARGVPDAERAPVHRLPDVAAVYAEGCRRNREQAKLAARRGDLESMLAMRRGEEARHREAREARAALSRRIHAAAGHAAEAAAGPGVSEEATEDAVRSAVEALSTRREELDRARRELEEAHRDHSRMVGLLAGATLRQLEERLHEMERSLGPYDPGSSPSRTGGRSAAPAGAPAGPAEAPAGPAEAPAGPPLNLERAAETAAAALDEARGAARRLEGQIAERTARQPDLAAAEERHAEAQQALERLLWLDEVLEKTIGFLDEAKDEVQREIAPRLRAEIAGELPAITSGRYLDLRIDPAQLEIHVQGPAGDWRSALALSHGTAEQVYLLLRIALARTLVTTGETAPLLLDDVTVQSDAERTRAILGLLHRESAERQIVLFSQEDDVLAWARARLGPRDRVIELRRGTTLMAAGEEGE